MHISIVENLLCNPNIQLYKGCNLQDGIRNNRYHVISFCAAFSPYAAIALSEMSHAFRAYKNGISTTDELSFF